MITKKKVNAWFDRKNKIEIQTTYKEEPNKNSWNNKSQKEVLNKHWICDYCGMAVLIKEGKDKEKQDGGEFWLPVTIMKKGAVKVVAHHRCLNKLIAEVEEYIEEERKRNESKLKEKERV